MELLLPYHMTGIFLDKVADSLYIFEGNAKIKHYVGMFTDYLKNAENEAVKTKKQSSATKVEKDR